VEAPAEGPTSPASEGADGAAGREEAMAANFGAT